MQQADVMSSAPTFERQDTPRVRPVIALLVALGISAVFVLAPWESVSRQGFPDRGNYLATINILVADGRHNFEYREQDVLSIVVNEYVWREVLTFIGNFVTEPENGISAISFLAFFIVESLIVLRAGVIYGFMFMSAPLTVDLFWSQTRSGLALALFMLAIALRRPWGRYALFVVAGLTHTFAAVLWLVYEWNKGIEVVCRAGLRTKVLALILGCAISVLWVYYAADIFSVIGDRRAHDAGADTTSVRFGLWWMLCLSALVLFAHHRPRSVNGQYVLLAIALLSTFVFTILFGGYAMRFLALSVPFVCIAIRSVRERATRFGIAGGVVGFNVIHSLYWVS